jgi:hypothetical protein
MLGDQAEIGRCADESVSATAVVVLPEISKKVAATARNVFFVITGNHLFRWGSSVLPGIAENGQRYLPGAGAVPAAGRSAVAAAGGDR